MKAYLKVIIVGAVILALGIGVLTVTLGINGWQIDGGFEMKTFECKEKNNTLDIDFSAGKLEVNYYDGETIKVEYPESKTWSTSISEVNGKLSFATTNKRTWFNFSSLFVKIPTTKIWIPQGDIMNVEIDMNGGTTKFSNGEYGDFDINMNAGTFSIGDLNCKKLTVKLKAGTISTQNIHSLEEASIEMYAGTINLKSAVCPSLECEVRAGSANIGKLQAQSIDVELKAGSVGLEIIGSKPDYNIYVDKSSGSCNISNQIGATDKRINAKLSAGSLTVKFSD